MARNRLKLACQFVITEIEKYILYKEESILPLLKYKCIDKVKGLSLFSKVMSVKGSFRELRGSGGFIALLS